MLTVKQRQKTLRQVKLLVLDVDGVMTDAGLILGNTEELKRFNSRDGAGMKFLLRHGVVVAVVSGRQSMAVERQCAELGISEIHQGQKRKLPVFLDLLKRHGLKAEEAAVMGDDLLDLPMMRRAGIGIAVADAVGDVRRRADWTTKARGGHGAVREVAEAILKAKGLWEKVLERYLG